MDVEAIKEAVSRFRSAMEEIHGQLGLTFKLFPRGCCGDVAELLAAFLKDEGFGDFTYVCGWRDGNGTSHAWLEKDGIIIDATADQFEDGVDRPMVTLDPDWHAQFAKNRQRRDNADFRADEAPAHLTSAYAQIQKQLA